MAANNLDLQEIELFNKRVLFKSYKCTNDKNITTKSSPFFKLTINTQIQTYSKKELGH